VKALGSFDTFLTAVCAAGGIFYLWRYFAFVGYDLEEFRPASTASVVWNILLSVGFPMLGLLHRFSDETNKTLVALGMSSILVPAILPELAPPRATSTLEWIYFRTIGKGIVDFVESSVITFLLFICWRFGSLWVAVYAGIAICFGMARASWLLVQGVPDPTVSAPPLRRMFMIFAAAFGWVTILSILFPLKLDEIHRDVSELLKPYVFTACTTWVLGRFPSIVPLLRPMKRG
jgi:hypothetical protein